MTQPNVATRWPADIAADIARIEAELDRFERDATEDESEALAGIDWRRWQDACSEIRAALHECAGIPTEPGPERLTLADVLPTRMIGRA